MVIKADEVLSDLGVRVREFREKRNLTQKNLANKVGCASSNISRIETGQILPSLPELLKISQVLSVEIGYLIFGIEKGKGDKLINDLASFKALFNPFSTTKHILKEQGTYEKEDFVFMTKEEYLVLTTDKISLISEIAKVDINTSDYSKDSLQIVLGKSIKTYNEKPKKEEKFFLLSGKQMSELIEEAVISELYGEALLKKLEYEEPYKAEVIKEGKAKLKL